MRIRHVARPHYVLTQESGYEKLHFTARQFWNRMGLPYDSAHAIVATENGKCIGFFRYTISGRATLHGEGTWIHPKHRKQGLALKLWKRALDKHEVKVVEVVVVSKGGDRLVTKVATTYPKIHWNVECNY